MSEQVGSASEGIVAREERDARAMIAVALADLGVTPRGPIDLRPIPFAGTWGVATSVCHQLAGEIVQAELEASGKLEGLSKKEAKKLGAEATRVKAQELAEQLAAKLGNGSDQGRAATHPSPTFAKVEAVNGYVNISFDANTIASRLIGEVLALGSNYGKGAPKAERVMVEHSQPNTHKVFHVGHLRNTVLGISVSNILAAAGYPVLQASYPGDIGMHVIKCLWCYERFHLGTEPADPAFRGRWLAGIYSESDARLNFRKDVLEFLHLLAKEDFAFVAAIDKLLKFLWRLNTHGEDISYLLGRFIHAQEIKDDLLREPDVIVKFWPIIGDQLREQVHNPKPVVPVEGAPEPTTTAVERLTRWEELDEHIDWWMEAPRWQEEVKATFQRWERQDPAFVKLWQETRDWSLTDFRRIFDELGAQIDVWFYESEVEQEGRQIVQELLAKGIAEIGEGGVPVVKIDEKLGLKQETYRTLPILRSDGTTLYSTKDLSLTKRKYEQFGIDRAIWVVDVRQSLYFQQIFKILELWGFEQAKHAFHLSYEIVALPEGVISSRKGNAPLYDDIRDQVMARAREIIDEKNWELAPATKELVARQVALGSLKYAMLARDNNKMVIFDIDEALSFDGHAAPYIQYAHARACRILERAGWTSSAVLNAQSSVLDFGALQGEELSLLQHISSLPDEVQRAAEEYRPLRIASYVYELAKKFNDFYHACPVLDSPEPTRTARLALVAATRTALANGLALLGIDAPYEM
ncbi:MAG: arginine--tRNA ligase [Thermomicrobiales bacterium]|nr:arginine--tRNA ligase [Thermomicrobiales bacterium]